MQAPAGLKGVIVADTTIGSVRGQEGFYHYREYDASDLARTRTVDDVVALLLDGALPTGSNSVDLGPQRVLPNEVASLVDAMSAFSADSLSVIRAGLLAIAEIEGHQPVLDIDHAQRRKDALRLIGAVPTIVARHYRRRNQLEPIEPDPTLGHAADYLRMATGDVPKDANAAAVEKYLSLIHI